MKSWRKTHFRTDHKRWRWTMRWVRKQQRKKAQEKLEFDTAVRALKAPDSGVVLKNVDMGTSVMYDSDGTCYTWNPQTGKWESKR